jgi:hypothetical protein
MTGFAQVKTLDDPDQHFDDTRRVDSDGEVRRKDNTRWRNRLYESNSASNALAELGSLLSFQVLSILAQSLSCSAFCLAS